MFLLSGWFRNKAKGLEPFATFLCSFLFLELIILCMMNSISTCVYFLSFFTTKMQYVGCGHCMYNESVFSARLQQNLANFSYQSSKYSHFGLCGPGLALPQLSYTNSSLQSICSSLYCSLPRDGDGAALICGGVCGLVLKMCVAL